MQGRFVRETAFAGIPLPLRVGGASTAALITLSPYHLITHGTCRRPG